MSDELSQDFIEQQRQRLEAMRDQMLTLRDQTAADEREQSQRHADEVQDSGDEGALEFRRDIDDALGAAGEWRLGEIRRALEKIGEDSYGLSDESGDPIGRARLQAVPEARFTVEEESERERREGR